MNVNYGIKKSATVEISVITYRWKKKKIHKCDLCDRRVGILREHVSQVP